MLRNWYKEGLLNNFSRLDPTMHLEHRKYGDVLGTKCRLLPLRVTYHRENLNRGATLLNRDFR